MKTLYILTVFAILGHSVSGQIIYTDEHLPPHDWVVTGHVGQPVSNEGIITEPGSTAQTWDFTDVLENPFMATQSFQLPEGLAGFEYFPNATSAFAIEFADPFSTPFVTFYEKTDEGLFIVGDYNATTNDENGVYLTNISSYTGYLEIPANITYGDQRIETVRSELISLAETPDVAYAQRIVRHQQITFDCDAWGTMYTPVYPNGVEVLRVLSFFDNQTIDSSFVDYTNTGLGEWELTSVDTIILEDVFSVYRFLQCDAANPLVAFAYEFDEVINMGYYGNVVSSVGAEEGPGLSIYPNPVQDGVVHVKLDPREDAFLRLSTPMGQVLLEKEVLGEASVTLPTAALPTGLLVLQVYNRQGQVRATGKVMKLR